MERRSLWTRASLLSRSACREFAVLNFAEVLALALAGCCMSSPLALIPEFACFAQRLWYNGDHECRRVGLATGPRIVFVSWPLWVGGRFGRLSSLH